MGREREYAVVNAAVTSTGDAAVGVAIVGEAGVGKTVLAKAACAGLDPGTYEAAYISGTQAGRPVPFGAVATLLPAGDEPIVVNPAQVYHRVAGELRRRAAGLVPVLVVDDAHWLDGPSAGVVLGLALGQVARLVVTARPTADAPDAVVALWKDHHLRRLDLDTLARSEVSALAEELLGGSLAEPTADLLVQWTGGNPLFIAELVRHGKSAGWLRAEGGLWWWRGPLAVPPVLAELLDRRLDGLPPAAHDALAAVSLAEPVPLQLVETVAPGMIEELEDRRLIRTESDGRRILVRLEHPLLAAAVRRSSSPLRRRRTASALLAAVAAGGPAAGNAAPGGTMSGGSDGPGLIIRALWQLESRNQVDQDLLLHAAELTLYPDPELSHRFATAVWEETGQVDAAMAVADALVELGEPGRAGQLLDIAAGCAGSAADQLAVAVARAGYRCWVRREPRRAEAELVGLRSAVPDQAVVAELDSVRALVLLFSARPAEALDLAEELLLRSGRLDESTSGPGQAPAMLRAALRARLTRSCALTLLGRTAEALEAAEDLVIDTARPVRGVPYLHGMAQAAVALAQLWRTAEGQVPLTDPAQGRWPVRPTSGPGQGSGPRSGSGWESGKVENIALTGLRPTSWPLFDGYVMRVRGDRVGAARRLREALVQQSGGEGLFRSEAAAWLTITLAESGQVEEAARVLAETPPDDVAIVPGLLPWAEAAVAAARGSTGFAAARLADAARAARASGARLVELGYLTQQVELAGKAGARALATPVSTALQHVDAPRLAAIARSTLVSPRARRTTGYASSSVPDMLTARESEVASLAAQGYADREIAESLVVSVRTVESHLARVYRKLGIKSRRELRRLARPLPA